MKSRTARKSAAEHFILASRTLEISLILKIRQKYTEISFPARNLISKTASGCPDIAKWRQKCLTLMTALFVSKYTCIEYTMQKRMKQLVEI